MNKLEAEKAIKQIKDSIKDIISVEYLEVKNLSSIHVGHLGNDGRGYLGVTHLEIVIISNDFQGRDLIKRHKTINNALAYYLKSGLHSVSIRAYTPVEMNNASVLL
ncbi:MAG: BolA family transcriptional regulator [Proteobacteria bacterium]|nr:BolA family transcriptional regulator [Pseudomonadota bacterium]